MRAGPRAAGSGQRQVHGRARPSRSRRRDDRGDQRAGHGCLPRREAGPVSAAGRPQASAGPSACSSGALKRVMYHHSGCPRGDLSTRGAGLRSSVGAGGGPASRRGARVRLVRSTTGHQGTGPTEPSEGGSHGEAEPGPWPGQRAVVGLAPGGGWRLPRPSVGTRAHRCYPAVGNRLLDNSPMYGAAERLLDGHRDQALRPVLPRLHRQARGESAAPAGTMKGRGAPHAVSALAEPSRLESSARS